MTDFIREGEQQWRSVCGGGPWNVACAMARMGQLSAFGGAISQDLFGQALWQASADAGLDLRFIQQLPKPPLLAMVHELNPPKYFIGTDSADLHFRAEGLPAGWNKAVRWAHFGSLALVRQPLAARLVALAEQLASGRAHQLRPNFRAPPMDSNYDETLERMCKLASLVKVSDEDLCGLFRAKRYHGAGADCRLEPECWLMLTRGSQGATLFRGSQELSALPPKITVADTVGAGDCSLAGLLDSLMSRARRGLGAAPAPGRWPLARRHAKVGLCAPAPYRVNELEAQVTLRAPESWSDQALLGRQHGGFRRLDVELLVDRLDVVVDGEPLDAHQVRDLLDREALAQVGQHFALTRRQALPLGAGSSATLRLGAKGACEDRVPKPELSGAWLLSAGRKWLSRRRAMAGDSGGWPRTMRCNSSTSTSKRSSFSK